MNCLRKKAVSFLLILSMFVCLVGVVNVDPAYAAAKKIHLKKTTVSVVAGKTYQQKLIDKSGKTVTASKVKWKSLKTSIAKINKKGKITAVKAGTAKMTAKYKGKTYKFTVKVKKPFTSGQKPTITDVTYFEEDDDIFIEWKKLKNAEKYQVYVSVNSGTFKLFETTKDDCSVYDDDIDEGNYYAFKVRAVGGTYKSSYSNVKEILVSDSDDDDDDDEEASDSAEYSESDYDRLKDYADKASDKNDQIDSTKRSWELNNYPAGGYVDLLKQEVGMFSSYIKLMKNVTDAKNPINCTTAMALNKGFKTWGDVLADCLKYCDQLQNATVMNQIDALDFRILLQSMQSDFGIIQGELKNY